MKKIFLGISLLFTPSLAHAEQINNLKELIRYVMEILGMLIPVIFSLALVFFLWYVFQYMFFTGGEQKAEARSMMLWGVFALFVMVSVWGLVDVLKNSFFEYSADPRGKSNNVKQIDKDQREIDNLNFHLRGV